MDHARSSGGRHDHICKGDCHPNIRQRMLMRNFWPHLRRMTLILLSALLAFQAARLVWVATKPLGPLGHWPQVVPLQRSLATLDLGTLEPFDGTDSDANGSTVTSLTLKLFGVSLNEATGLGSAIIATPDGVQSSFAAGDEIVPGVKLKAVAYDHVTLDNGGTEESLFLDQSVAPASGAAGFGGKPTASGSGVFNAASFTTDIALTPRTVGSKVTGFVVQPKGEGSTFTAVGLKPGDVIVSMNGVPAQSVQDAVAVISQLPDKGNLTLQVERGGKLVPLNARISK